MTLLSDLAWPSSAFQVSFVTLVCLFGVLGGGEAGIEKRISSGPDIPWVEILTPLPAQLIEDGSFDTVDLSFVIHGIEMGPESAVAEVFILRSLSLSLSLSLTHTHTHTRRFTRTLENTNPRTNIPSSSHPHPSPTSHSNKFNLQMSHAP